MPLTEDDKEILLHIARAKIEAVIEGEPMPSIMRDSMELQKHSGAFVSVYLDGSLRGCIGHIKTEKPLHETVEDVARLAVTGDMRFRPIRPAHLHDITIEVSVLSPVEPLEDLNDFVLGHNGLIVEKDGKTGLLLPQVATAHGFDKKKFIEETCLKAGLEKDSYLDTDIKLYTFTAEVFKSEPQEI